MDSVTREQIGRVGGGVLYLGTILHEPDGNLSSPKGESGSRQLTPTPTPESPGNRRTNGGGHAPFYQYHDFRQLSARLYRRHRRDFERRRRTWLWIQGKVWPESTPHGTAKARGFGQEPVPRMRKARDITKLRGKKRPT